MDNNKKKYICDNGDVIEENKTRVEERIETYDVKGESVTVPVKARVCPTCSADVSDESLDDLALQTAFDVYRRNHKIVFPTEIRAMRESYGLSQRALSGLLDWGAITIQRYEAGSLPDEAHNQVLRLIQDPFNMAKIVEEKRGQQPEWSYQNRLARLVALLSEKAPEKVAQVLNQSSQRPSGIYTGYVDFHAESLMEMMVFFANKARGVLKTKLNKLLWYSDFLHYKHHARSISGAAYAHYPYGPVPENYGLFLASLCATNTLTLNEVDFGINRQGEPMLGEEISASREPQLEEFPQSAIVVLQAVHKYFAPLNSKNISDLSHQEDGYKETGDRELISYAFAERLKVDPLARK